VGAGVNLAARLCAAAHPGHVLVVAGLADRVPGGAIVAAGRMLSVPGLREPVATAAISAPPVVMNTAA
jgi:class 3 adenylate cyclase